MISCSFRDASNIFSSWSQFKIWRTSHKIYSILWHYNWIIWIGSSSQKYSNIPFLHESFWVVKNTSYVLFLHLTHGSLISNLIFFFFFFFPSSSWYCFFLLLWLCFFFSFNKSQPMIVMSLLIFFFFLTWGRGDIGLVERLIQTWHILTNTLGTEQHL